MASSSSLLSSAVLVIFLVSHAQAATPNAPAPAVDCSSLILNMADCLSYVSNGSTVAKPEGTCCTGLKTVLKADAGCLCETFRSSAQLGVVLNVTKAATLPAACKVSAPSSATNCGLSVTPSGAPALSPSDQVTSPSISAPAPDSGISNPNAPSPTPGSNGGAAGLSISVGSMVVALVVASFSSF